MPQWNCANCSAALRRVGHVTAATWKCDQCSIRWITRAGLVGVIGSENLTKLTECLVLAPPATRPLTCPECETATFRVFTVGSTEIDICTTCHGLILDPDEVVRAIHQHLDFPPQTPGMTAMDVASGASGLCDIAHLVLEIATLFIP